MLTKKLKRVIKQIMVDKDVRLQRVDHLKSNQVMAEAFYRILRENNGRIAVYESSMDCDCARSRSCIVYSMKAYIEFRAMEEQFYKGLEGPGAISFEDPKEAEEFHYSQDLGLEAFENGHPHYVTY